MNEQPENNEQPEIMTKPLPEILEDMRSQHEENRKLIQDLTELYEKLQEALEATTRATEGAHRAAAEAREAGIKAAEQAERAASEAREAGLQATRDLRDEMEKVLKKATEALYTISIIGSALMTAADGGRNVSENLIKQLETKFEFKK